MKRHHTTDRGDARDIRLVIAWTGAALVIGIVVNLATMAGWPQ